MDVWSVAETDARGGPFLGVKVSHGPHDDSPGNRSDVEVFSALMQNGLDHALYSSLFRGHGLGRVKHKGWLYEELSIT